MGPFSQLYQSIDLLYEHLNMLEIFQDMDILDFRDRLRYFLGRMGTCKKVRMKS